MINAFVLRKMVALVLCPLLVTVLFFIGSRFYGLLWGVGFLLIGLLLSYIIGAVLLSNPFSKMLEGKGLLAINIDSTGILRPFIVSLAAPYIRGKLKNKPIEDVFDRDTIFQISEPKKSATKAEMLKEGGIKIELTEREYNKARFALFHYPVILYNEQINSIITKDFLADKEKDSFAEHGVLYLNRKVEELTSHMRDFGRYVVELLKPKTEWFKSKWIWIIIGVIVVILIALFLPSILQQFGVNLGGGGGTTPPSNPIIPR